MPNIKSQKKRVITNAKSNARNKSNSSALKTVLKKAYASIEAGADQAEVVSTAYSAIDVAVRKGTLNKNAAARRKAQIATAAAKAE